MADGYWQRRAAARMEHYLDDSEKALGIIGRSHAEALRYLQAEVSKLYAKFGRDFGLDEAEVRRILAEPVGRAEYERLLAQIAKVKDADIRRRLEAQASSGAYAYRIGRLEALQLQVEVQAAQLGDVEQKAVSDSLAGTARDAYSRSMYDVQREAGVGFSFEALDTKAVREILHNPWSGQTFSARIWKNTDALAETMNELLTASIMAGRSSAQVAREMADRMGVGYRATERLVRTETNYVANAAEMQSYKEAGLGQYEFMATLDMKTSEVCQDLDGKIVNVADAMPGVNMPPMHPNCLHPDSVAWAPSAHALIRSTYSGDIVKVSTSNCGGFSVTPNHIMLTSRGWVRAKNLVKGDKVVRYRGWAEFTSPSPSWAPANNDSVPTIEKLFASVVESGLVSSVRMPGSAEYLKGDVSKDDEISVVNVDGFLRDKINAPASKFLRNAPLVEARVPTKCALSGFGTLDLLLVGIRLAADGVMGGNAVASILFRGALAHHELIGLPEGAHYDARLLETANNDGCGDVESLGELLDALSAFVALDDIVDIKVFNFCGHVYDASSLSTLYLANGYLSSNCRSTTVAHFEGYDRSRLMRRARDPVTGESVLVPRDMTYKDWLKLQEEHYGEARIEAARKMAVNEGRDKAQYGRYMRLIGKNYATESFSAFQLAKYTDADVYRLLKLDYTRRNALAADGSLALPNAGRATAAEAKFTGYLFNPEQKDGWPKGVAITSRLGYTIDSWELLQKAITSSAGAYPATHRGDDQYGASYEQKIVLYGIKNKPANLVIGWKVKDDKTWMTTAMIKEVD